MNVAACGSYAIASSRLHIRAYLGEPRYQDSVNLALGIIANFDTDLKAAR